MKLDHDAIRLNAADRRVFVFFPAVVLKSSASAMDADSVKIASVVCQYFTRRILPLLLSTRLTRPAKQSAGLTPFKGLQIERLLG
jgi:hypothetical protein